MKNKLIKLIENGLTVKEICLYIKKERPYLYKRLTQEEIDNARQVWNASKQKKLSTVLDSK